MLYVPDLMWKCNGLVLQCFRVMNSPKENNVELFLKLPLGYDGMIVGAFVICLSLWKN